MKARTRSAPRCVAAVAAALVLAACSADPAPTPPPEPEQPVSTVSAKDLARAKARAGIEDCPPSDPAVAAVPSGLPDLVLRCLGGGREVRLAGLRGRPMVVNIWAQWCKPCREEAPLLTEVAKANRSEVMFLGINYLDTQPDWAIEFADLSDWTFPQLQDQEKTIQAPLKIVGPPVTLLVRADGTIAYRHSGPFRSTEQLRSEVGQYLGVTL